MNSTPPRSRWARLLGTSRLERALNLLSALAILILLAAIVLWRLPSPYQILLPATAVGVDAKIAAAGHPPASGRGQFYMTFVSEPDSNKLEELIARFDPDASLEPTPPDYSPSQAQQANAQMMLSSEQTAELVALCHLGYTNLCSGGVAVAAILSYSKAAPALHTGDVITGLGGKPLTTAAQLRAALAGVHPGAVVTLTVRRAGHSLTLRVPTVASPTERGRTVLGISVQDAPPTMPAKLPIDITVNAGDIGGPSAGLMFTLGILQRLSPTDLTKGYCVAGTGTISLDGSVGAIGGVKQKVIGAQWAHAQYFFVPIDGNNYADAQKVVGKRMTLVPVRSLDDALAFLNRLPKAQKICH